MELYHFTCTARLPWIVADRELRPGRNKIGGFPDPDFLWATKRSQGDRTASAMQGYRKGKTALVRLTVRVEDFEPWPAITARSPQWTTKHMRVLEASARNLGEDIGCWYARVDPLPLSRFIRAEAKSYAGKWKVVQLSSLQHPTHSTFRGVVLNDEVWFSAQDVREDGQPTGYHTGRMSLEDWFSSTVPTNDRFAGPIGPSLYSEAERW
jgi:hypothetical protein